MSDLLWASILLCLVAGSAIDTSNICLVRAASNLSAGKPAVAIGILLVTATASVVFYLNTQFGLHYRTLSWSLPTLTTFAGALIFALGSLLNGACAVGTIGRLARGDIGHLATFVGALMVIWLLPRAQIAQQASTPALTSGAAWLLIVLAFTAVMMGFGRRHLRGIRLGPYVVLGVVAAVVTDWQGNWTWLNLLQQVQAGVPVRYTALACIAAVLAGAVLTAVFRGRFRLVRPDPKAMLLEAAGGGLMVAGAILIPGANDALSVYGVPSGSPNALAGYAAMFVIMVVVARFRRSGFMVAR